MLQIDGKTPKERRAAGDVSEERGPRVGAREEQLSQRPKPFAAAEPADVLRPHRELDLRAGLREQDGGFDRALTAADHDHAFARQAGEVRVLAGVRADLPREFTKLRWSPREEAEAGGDDDPSRFGGVAVIHDDTQPIRSRFDAHDPAGVEVGGGLSLEPGPVAHEVLERRRSRKPSALEPLKAIKTERAGGGGGGWLGAGAPEGQPPGAVVGPEIPPPAEEPGPPARG